MKVFLSVLIFSIVFASLFEAGAASSRNESYFYQMTLSSESLSAPQLTEKLQELGAKNASKTELSTVRLKSHYFHFYLKRTKIKELFDYLQASGAASRIQKIASQKSAAKGEVRFVIWLTNTAPLGPLSMVLMTENYEKTRADLLQDWKPSQKSGSRRIVVGEMNETKIIDLMKWGLKSGPIQFFFDSVPAESFTVPVFCLLSFPLKHRSLLPGISRFLSRLRRLFRRVKLTDGRSPRSNAIWTGLAFPRF